MKQFKNILIITTILFVVLFAGCSGQTVEDNTAPVVEADSNNNPEVVEADADITSDLNTESIDSDVEIGELI